jgi:putative DNA primase/helicase
MTGKWISPKEARRQHDKTKRGEAGEDGGLALGNEYFFDGYVVDRFVEAFGESFRYVHRWSRWLTWDGRCWQEEQTQLVREHLGRIAAQLAENHQKRLAAGRIEAIERLAQAQRVFARPPDAWDVDPLLLNTQTCTIDLSTGDHHPHQTNDNLTKLAGAGASSDGNCARWKQFLDEVTAGDVELQAYLQRMAGYCLTGSTREEVFFFAYGTGSNGKTTFVETLAAVLGSYARNVPAETFLEAKSERHPTELAAMQGYRLITATEVKRGARWHETRVKELTGGDTVSARFMRQDFFEYRPQFKLLISGNHKPRLRSVDEAMRRRLHLLPFTVTIAKSKRDLGLKAKLREERNQILQWALDGCRDWIAEGLNPPPKVLEATNAYFEAMDVLGRWLAERCEVGKTFDATSKELFADWKSWCEDNGETVGFQKGFGQALESQGFIPAKGTGGTRLYRGLRLTCSAPSELPLSEAE